MVAVTVMANMGLHRLLAENGIRTVTTDVGDRYVLEALRREGGILGGEQSGHLIWLDGHVTGDGLVAALLLCSALHGRPLAEATAVMPRFPQAKENVSFEPHGQLSPTIAEEVARLNAELGDRGRVLVRPSGTEPVIRVLAEAETGQEAEALCGRIAALVRRELG
jgi:phosphoglucosamine mutase